MRFPSIYVISLAVFAGCAHSHTFGVQTRLAMTQAALDAELSDAEVVGPGDYTPPSTQAERAAPYTEPEPEEEVDLSALTRKERRQLRRQQRRAERQQKKRTAEVAKAVGPSTSPVRPDEENEQRAVVRATEPPVREDARLAIPVAPTETTVSPARMSHSRPSLTVAPTPQQPVAEVSPPALRTEPAPSVAPPNVVTLPGMPALVSGTDERLVSAVEKISHSLDEQRWAQLLEARLSDKQRLIDRLQTDVDHLRGQPAPALPSVLPSSQLVRPQGDDGAVQRQLLELERRQADSFSVLREELRAKQQAKASPELLILRQQLEDQAKKMEALQAQLAKPSANQAEDPQLKLLRDQLAEQAEQLEELRRKKSRERQGEGENKQLLRRLDRQEKLLKELAERGAQPEPSDRLERLLKKQQEHLDARLERLERHGQPTEAPPAHRPSPQERSPELDEMMRELKKTRETIEKQRESESAERASTASKLALLEAELERARHAPTEDSEDLRARLDELEQERNRIDALEQTMQGLREERAGLEAQVEEANEARRRELEEERAANAKRTAELEQDLAALRERTAEMEKLYTEQYASVLAQLQPLIDAGLDVRVVAGKIRLQLPSDVLFGSGSTHLSRQGKKDVREVAAALEPFRSLRIQVEGHTDNVPVRSFQFDSNWDLAFARAKSVMEILLEDGLTPDRVSAASYGDSRPIASNDNKKGRAQNRRIEMVLQLEQDLETNK